MSAASHWPLLLGLVLIAGFGSWVFIHSNRSYLLRWAVIPLSLVVAALSAEAYDARLGYAAPRELPEKFIYLGHQVVVEDLHKAGLEVWARTSGTRLYRIPYSKPMEQALERAREQSKGGLPVAMRKEAAGAAEDAARADGSSGEPEHAAYRSNVMLPSEVNPKT